MFLIALIPALALFYLSIHYMNDKYETEQKSRQLMLLANLTQQSSRLIHNLQVERGLSAGYISSSSTPKAQQRLREQEQRTNTEYTNFLRLVHEQKKDMQTINQLTFNHYKYLLHTILSQLSTLQNIRKGVLHKTVTFDKMLEFYNKTDAQLIHLIKIITLLFNNPSMGPFDIYNLELLKEKAGQERAYMYHLLLSKEKNDRQIIKVQTLIQEQNRLQQEFLHASSHHNTKLYKSLITSTMSSKINELRHNIFASDFNKKYAPLWFETMTLYIDSLQSLSLHILKDYLQSINTLYAQTSRSLYISLGIWLLSLFSFAFLTFIVNRLINKQAKFLKELQIASYTFDSHEAIIITDPYGIIVKTNKAFSRITGYSPQESIGQSTKILKSFRHDEAFYAQMWSELLSQGYWSGEIQNRRKNGELYFEKLSITAIKDSQGNTTNYIAQFMDITELKRAKELAQYQSEHDFLTDLPNRKALMNKLKEELARAKRHHYLNAFIFLDLDGFKQVNDTYGHKIGDELLIEVTHRLRRSVREEDFISRLSGDEFAIILSNFSLQQEKTKSDISSIAQKIINTLDETMKIDGHHITIGASLGIRLFPEDAPDGSAIVRDADNAMYEAKKKGKGQFVFYCQTQ